MPTDPDLVRQQRELLYQWRSATQTRGEVETAAKVRLTDARKKATLQQDELLKQAQSQLDEVHKFHRWAITSLARAGLQDRLAVATRIPNGEGDAQAELGKAAAVAATKFSEIEDSVQALLAERRAAAARRKTLQWVVVLSVLVLVALLFFGYLSWQSARRERAAQATATAETQMAQATATAETQMAQATATAVTQAAIAKMPAELQPLFERYGLSFDRVPVGTFKIGSANGGAAALPVSAVELAEFWIGHTEVTNGQYQFFLEAGGYDDAMLWTDAGWEWRTDQGITQPACLNESDFNAPGQPVVCISWYEAVAYANWLSRETGLAVRLPSEAEWEKAARGSDGRTYPWGESAPSSDLANYGGNVGKPAPVGSYPAGASPYGALDMAGNVWKWTSTRYANYPYMAGDGREDVSGVESRVIRGGSWTTDRSSLVATQRYKADPDVKSRDLGFRVVVIPQPATDLVEPNARDPTQNEIPRATPFKQVTAPTG